MEFCLTRARAGVPVFDCPPLRAVLASHAVGLAALGRPSIRPMTFPLTHHTRLELAGA